MTNANLQIIKSTKNGLVFYKNAAGKKISKKAASKSIAEFGLTSKGYQQFSPNYGSELFSAEIIVKNL